MGRFGDNTEGQGMTCPLFRGPCMEGKCQLWGVDDHDCLISSACEAVLELTEIVCKANPDLVIPPGEIPEDADDPVALASVEADKARKAGKLRRTLI